MRGVLGENFQESLCECVRPGVIAHAFAYRSLKIGLIRLLTKLDLLDDPALHNNIQNVPSFADCKGHHSY